MRFLNEMSQFQLLYQVSAYLSFLDKSKDLKDIYIIDDLTNKFLPKYFLRNKRFYEIPL